MLLFFIFHREPFFYVETKLQSIQAAATKGENFFSRSFQVGWDYSNLITAVFTEDRMVKAIFTWQQKEQNHEVNCLLAFYWGFVKGSQWGLYLVCLFLHNIMGFTSWSVFTVKLF